MHNEVLIILVWKVVTVVVFADDLALVVAAKHPKDVEIYTTETVDINGLENGIMSRRKKDTVKPEVSGHMVSQPIFKYRGGRW